MYDIVIAGAGIAGLNLCNLIKNLDEKKVCLIEKSGRIGGHIFTQRAVLKNFKKKSTKKQSNKKQSNKKQSNKKQSQKN